MAKYAQLNKNDMINGEGVSVSYWTQGCPHRCPGCHNPETWNFDGGNEKDEALIIEEIIKAISANDIQRNFSVLGGEPLCEENIASVLYIIQSVKKKFPTIKIYLWTGYTFEELKKQYYQTLDIKLQNIDVLITGRYIQEERDITLPLRGSKNQKVLYRGIDF